MAGKHRGLVTKLRDNALAIVLLGLFVVFLAGQSIAGYLTNNSELQSHGQATITFLEYITTGNFIEAVFENWESEFLQMGALVWLVIPVALAFGLWLGPHTRRAVVMILTGLLLVTSLLRLAGYGA